MQNVDNITIQSKTKLVSPDNYPLDSDIQHFEQLRPGWVIMNAYWVTLRWRQPFGAFFFKT